MNEQVTRPGTCDKPLLPINISAQHLLLLQEESGLVGDTLTRFYEDKCWRQDHADITDETEGFEESSTLLSIIDNDSNRKPETVAEDGSGVGGKVRGQQADGDDPLKDLPTQERSLGRGCFQRYRDVVAYWWLGFCNNFTYWVMITAAYDLLTPEYQDQLENSWGETSEGFTGALKDFPTDSIIWVNESSPLHPGNSFTCQEQSTGAILVADTLPATALSLAAPLTFLVPVNIRVGLVITLCTASYLTLGLAHARHVFLGVALASASRGFSDSAFLGYASNYQKKVLSAWSSGTGAATFIGPLLYSCLTTGGFDPRLTLLVFLAIPMIAALSFWCLLSQGEKEVTSKEIVNYSESTGFLSEHGSRNEEHKMVKFKENFLLFVNVLKIILPLGLFYFIMYLTNQGLLELIYFPSSLLTQAQQYSWSNTIRCFGTFISRSAHTMMLIPNSWVYNSAALAIMCIIGTEVYYHYLPSEYIVFTLLLIQGLLEGAAFRTTVFKIHNQTSDKERSFCLGVFPSSLFPPALIAGLASIPVHNIFCKHHAFKT